MFQYRTLVIVGSLVLVAIPSLAQQPKEATYPGRTLIEEYFRTEVKKIQQADLADIKTLADWESRKILYRRELLSMLGLFPMPERTPLQAKVTGKVEAEKYTIEKVVFQSMPGLYVTGNLYIPKPAPKNAPTVLYVCGHGNVVKDGISYGSKVAYQHHPHWYATNGYVCLIIDTLQLSEIPGDHHGTHRLNEWWWHCKGYTPAGVECWNAMRALDYLETRPEVDATRFGVAGRSGGGAYSWWITATDERIKCAVPVAGIADLQAHLNEGYPGRMAKGVITGHCDCMFMHNLYQFDFSKVAALCAPRPVLLSNSDNDAIFPVPGYRRLATKVQKIYQLYGKENQWQLWETKGEHKDTPELRAGEYGWMNRWLKNSKEPVVEVEYERHTPEELKVLAETPKDQRNTTIQKSFIPTSLLSDGIPTRADWERFLGLFEFGMRAGPFRNWPREIPRFPGKPNMEVVTDGIKHQVWILETEPGVHVPLYLKAPAKESSAASVTVHLCDDAMWDRTVTMAPEKLQKLLPTSGVPLVAPKDEPKAPSGGMHLYFAPRGLGGTRWAKPGSPDEIHYKRRFALIGQTLHDRQILDTTYLLAFVVNMIPKDTAYKCVAQDELAGVALHAAYFAWGKLDLELTNLSSTYEKGPYLLHVMKYWDMPQMYAIYRSEFPSRKVELSGEKTVTKWYAQLQEKIKK